MRIGSSFVVFFVRSVTKYTFLVNFIVPYFVYPKHRYIYVYHWKLENAKYILLINFRGRSFLYHAADKQINLQLHPYLLANFCWCIYSCRHVVEPSTSYCRTCMFFFWSTYMHVSVPVSYTSPSTSAIAHIQVIYIVICS